MKIELGPHGRYLIDFDTREQPRYTTDVLVVGAGIAGLCAALEAARDRHVLVVLKDEPDVSNTAWAQGGIAAALGNDDSVADHVADTLRTGCGLSDEALVNDVIGAGPDAVRWLAGLGAQFERSDGGFALGQEGGHGKRRVVHYGDTTGAECVRALAAAAVASPNIHLMPRVFVLDLLTVDGRCVGAIARREDDELFTIAARSVVLAAGGAGRMFRETSNVRGATGDGIAAAFRAGAEVRDVEFVQFHPTTLYLAGTERTLVTEAVRGDGARIIDNLGQRFLADVHEAAELAPRDIVSRAILDRLGEPDVTDVFLDMRHWQKGHAAERFPGLVRLCRRYGLDPERDPIPVRPAAHYFIGGVACDADGRTSLPGLFACGEAASTGLHGANRLASNSLLEGLVLGRRVGTVAAAEPGERFTGHVSHAAMRDSRSEVDVADLRESLISRMWRSVGVRREAAELTDTWESFAQWRHFSGRLPLFTRAAFELENLLLLGSLVTAAARTREESRGTHNRLDFPNTDDVRFRGRFQWTAGTEGRFVPIGVVTRG